MKSYLRLLVVTFALLAITDVFSQTFCESFDGITVPAANKAHAFNIYGNGNNGFLSRWYVPSGTPSVFAAGDISGVSPYNGGQYALVGVCDVSTTSTDGLEVQFAFNQGESYQVTLMARNTPIGGVPSNPIDVDFVLLQNLIPYTYNTNTGCSSLPPIPSGAVVAHTMTNFTMNSWQLISFNIPTLNNSYTHLWIRPRFSSGAALSTVVLLMDSFCINQMGCNFSVNLGSDTSICNNQTLVLDATTTNATYSWQNGHTGATLNVSAPGIYSVTVTDNNGCNVTDQVTVTSADITVNTAATNATCGVNNGTASVAVSSGSGPFTYLWSNNASTASIANLGSGTYTVTVNGAAGCSATGSVVLNATGSISLNANSVNTTCGNNNGSATVTVVSGSGNYNYSWSNGSSATTTSNLAAGVYTVTVDDGTGCSATASVNVAPSGAGSVALISDKTAMCSGDSALICVQGQHVSYLWNTGQTGQCIYAKLAGNYYVTTTDAGNCTASSNVISVAVHPLPAVSLSVNGDTLRAFDASSYQWYFNDSPIPGADGNIHIAQQPGNYSVAVTDSNGCIAFSTKINITAVGISETISNLNFAVFPNPIYGQHLVLQCSDELIGSAVVVYDMAGQLIYSGIIGSRLNTYDMKISAGVYIVSVVYKDNPLYRKFTKL